MFTTAADAERVLCGNTTAADAARAAMIQRMAAEGMMRVVEKEGRKNVE